MIPSKKFSFILRALRISHLNIVSYSFCNIIAPYIPFSTEVEHNHRLTKSTSQIYAFSANILYRIVSALNPSSLAILRA